MARCLLFVVARDTSNCMAHRDLSEVFESLRNHMTTDAACVQAAQCLGKGVEIGIVLADTVDAAFFKNGSGAALEHRPAKNPDVIFRLSVSAADVLSSQSGLSLGHLGVEVLKQIVAGEIKIEVQGSLFSILKNGYLNIIKDAGAPFAQFLAEKGVSSLSKIPELIAKLKKN